MRCWRSMPNWRMYARMFARKCLGHIRYAWWEESLAAITEGHKPREHPVLQAIAENQLAAEGLQLAQKHRAVYPEDMKDEVDVAALVPQAAIIAWNKAGGIIASHRKKYGRKWNGWLTVKLLVA
jgi:hypothetical protein